MFFGFHILSCITVAAQEGLAVAQLTSPRLFTYFFISPYLTFRCPKTSCNRYKTFDALEPEFIKKIWVIRMRTSGLQLALLKTRWGKAWIGVNYLRVKARTNGMR